MLQLIYAKKSRDLKEFIDFPYKLYKNNRYFVPPIYFDMFNTLRKDKNPAFEFCEAEYIMVKDGPDVVGRMACIINRREIEKWKKPIGRFGWIDFVDDYNVSKMLFDEFESWLKKHNLEYAHGPLGFTDMDPEGMLIEGFDELGTLPMIYNYDYYQKHIEALGYKKDIDWVEYEVKVPDKIPEKIERVNRIVMEKLNLKILKVKRSGELRKYAKDIFRIQNESYGQLYGFVELTEKQMECYTDQYFSFIDSDYVKVVMDENSNPVGFGIAMPSLSTALQRSGGKMFPFGFIHFLYALKFPKKIDLYLIGVKKEYQDLGVNALMMAEITKSCIKHKIKTAETSGELETNNKIQSFWKYFEHRQHKRRRCFIKRI